MEGKVVRLSDKIAYINHDIDDAERAGILSESELPEAFCRALGHSTRERLNTLIHDIVKNSYEKPDIYMSQEIEEAMQGLRSFLFEHVYYNPEAKQEERKAREMIQELYRYYNRHADRMPKEYLELIYKKNQPQERVVCDYIAGMTDQYAIDRFAEIFIPKAWRG